MSPNLIRDPFDIDSPQHKNNVVPLATSSPKLMDSAFVKVPSSRYVFDLKIKSIKAKQAVPKLNQFAPNYTKLYKISVTFTSQTGQNFSIKLVYQFNYIDCPQCTDSAVRQCGSSGLIILLILGRIKII